MSRLLLVAKLILSHSQRPWQGQLIGTTLAAAMDYRQADYKGSLIVLMGNEQAGLTTPLIDMCDQLIKILRGAF